MPVELLSLGYVNFTVDPPAAPSAPSRADIACFVGFVKRRPGPLPESIVRWLQEHRWLEDEGFSRGDPADVARLNPYARAGARELLDVPVPVESWTEFDHLFAWEDRAVLPEGHGFTYLGAAVRSFFAQGGHRCYIVRVGDPLPHGTPLVQREAQLNQLLSGFRGGALPSPADRTTWRGIGHLHGLPDVSFLLVPDLPDLLGNDPEAIVPPEPPPPPEPVFEECSVAELKEEAEPPPVAVARLDETQYAKWARTVHVFGELLAEFFGEVQLIAAVPLPSRRASVEHDLPKVLATTYLNRSLDAGPTGLGSSFIQLVYPWAVTPGSHGLPEGIEPPDGILAGILARVVLLRGAYRTAAAEALGDVADLVPSMAKADLSVDDGRERDLRVFPDRITTLGRSSAGLRLLSDTTPSLDEHYRPAAVHRLVSVILRSMRRLGERIVWEPSGPRLWEKIRRSAAGMLEALWETGALDGATSDEAYTIRCDRTTMTASDLENGRLVVQISFTASAPIQRITVNLAMDESGRVSLRNHAGRQVA